jgi:holo-[acyl-carrier protein] synthase
MDLCAVVRVMRVWERHGDRFLRRAFHDAEIEAFGSLSPHSRPVFLASRWAAKEATYKAFGRARLQFPEIEIASAPTGPPFLQLHGSTAEILREAGVSEARLSLTHEEDVAGAVVLLFGQLSSHPLLYPPLDSSPH